MKRCPTCEKTFDDNLRFCQTDGTELVEVAEEIDPYKTMVAKPEDIAAAMSSLTIEPEQTPAAAEEPKEEEVLEIPAANDPLKTMIASEEEIRAAMASGEAVNEPEEPVVDIPPIAEPDAPQPPQFSEPELNPPSFGESISSGSLSNAPMPDKSPLLDEFSKTSPPIPSPFSNMPEPAAKEPAATEPPAFTPEPQTPPPSPFAGPEASPFSDSPVISAGEPLTPAGIAEPELSDTNMQNQYNQQFTPPGGAAPAAAGQSQVLAIVSLVCGILSLICCSWFIVGLAAVILGFVARGKANSDPANYGGAGLAMVGIILGAISLLLGVVFWVLYLLGFAAQFAQGF